jgi:hypothetical protein
MGNHPLQANIGGMLLQGYDLPIQEIEPGDTAHLVLYLKVDKPYTLTTSLVLSDGSGQVLESHDEWLTPQRGIARVRFDVPAYARTPPGEYSFQLSSGTNSVFLARRLRITGTPEPDFMRYYAGDWRLGQFVHLIGFKVERQVGPGSQLPVYLYWQTPVKLKERYTVFAQLVGTQYNSKTNGPLWAGHDSEPLDGGYPTTQWFVDVPIADTHVLTIPHDTPPGEYELWAGMYTQPDIKRLPVYDSQGNLVGDHVVLGKVTVMAK